MNKVCEYFKRTIGKQGGSKTITLPSEFDRYMKYQHGDEVKVGLFADKDGLFIVIREKV